MRPHRPSFLQSFSRSQVTSAAATAVDFGTLFLFTEILHVWYVASVAIGAFLGAVTNFFMNRHWSFSAAHGELPGQAVRYSLVSGGSLLLNTFGVWAITENFHIHYFISVCFISLFVGFLYNYPLQRHWVFK